MDRKNKWRKHKTTSTSPVLSGLWKPCPGRWWPGRDWGWMEWKRARKAVFGWQQRAGDKRLAKS